MARNSTTYCKNMIAHSYVKIVLREGRYGFDLLDDVFDLLIERDDEFWRR